MLVTALQGCDWDADKAYKVRRFPTSRQPHHRAVVSRKPKPNNGPVAPTTTPSAPHNR